MIKRIGKIFNDDFCDQLIGCVKNNSEQLLQFPYSEDKDIRISDIDIDCSFLIDFINSVMPDEYKLWYKKISPKSAFTGEHVYYHQECRFVISWELNPTDFLQCFIALEDLDYCPLVVAEHDIQIEHEKFMSQTGISKEKIKSEYLKKIPKDSFKTYSLRKGEGILFDYFAVHSSVGNVTPYDQPRGIFQLIKKGVNVNEEVVNNAAINKLNWEIDVLSKMLDNRKTQEVIIPL